jgi:hypothetical protein
MWALLANALQRATALLAASVGGFVVSGPGLPAAQGRLVSLILHLVLGAFCGLLLGLLTRNLLRFASVLVGRNLSPAYWTLGAVLLGMSVFVLIAVIRE